MRMRSLVALCFWTATGALVGTAPLRAQTYPDRPVKIVVPFPAGGSNDIIARLVGQKLADRLGQNFVVENRAGAGGNVGAEAVANAEPDGYTLLVTAPPPLTINQNLYKELRFKPDTAFAPVALLATVPIVLAVHPKLGVSSVAELVALAKKQPGQLSFASSGNGSTNHLSGELLKRTADIALVHVPYRGAGPAMNDFVAGHVPIMFDNIPAVLPQIEAKTIVAIAVAGSTRAKALPNVPTIAESGYPNFQASAWFGLVAPAKTPKAVLQKLEDSLKVVLREPEMQKRLAELGAEPSELSGATFGAFMAEETQRWATIIRESGAKVD